MKPIRAIGFDYFGVIGGVFGVDKKMLVLARRLKEQGYTIGILSNMAGSGARLCDKHHLEIFDVVLTSGDIGYTKPDKKAYEVFATALGVELDELLFIDDARSYMEIMKSYGIRGILYTNFDRLIKLLKKEVVRE